MEHFGVEISNNHIPKEWGRTLATGRKNYIAAYKGKN